MICFWNTRIPHNQIDHKFLVRGHTYLPNDRYIKKRKATARVCLPEEWEDVITSAWQKNPYSVQQMATDLIYVNIY